MRIKITTTTMIIIFANHILYAGRNLETKTERKFKVTK